MCLCSNQLGRFFATAETYKDEFIEDIPLDNLKLHPVIDHSGTYIFMLPNSLPNTPVLYLTVNFQFRANLVFLNYLKTVVIVNYMKMFFMTIISRNDRLYAT